MKDDDKNIKEWLYCPICGNKTRLKLRQDTVLTHFPLFCPKCKRESLIDAKNFKVTQVKQNMYIEKPDA